MSYGTSDTTVISSTKTEAHNLNTTNASAATDMDGPSPVNLPGNTAENRQEQHLCREKGKTCIVGGCFWLVELHLVTSKKKKGDSTSWD